MEKPRLITLIRFLKGTIKNKLSIKTDMINELNKMEESRDKLLLRTEQLNDEEYNRVPDGFNNNIIWNMGHMLVVSEAILYKYAPNHRPVHGIDRSKYGKGSKPDTFISNDEILLIRKCLKQTINLYKSAAGLTASTDDAKGSGEFVGIDPERVPFLLFHEDIHHQRIALLLQKQPV